MHASLGPQNLSCLDLLQIICLYPSGQFRHEGLLDGKFFRGEALRLSFQCGGFLRLKSWVVEGVPIGRRDVCRFGLGDHFCVLSRMMALWRATVMSLSRLLVVAVFPSIVFIVLATPDPIVNFYHK